MGNHPPHSTQASSKYPYCVAGKDLKRRRIKVILTGRTRGIELSPRQIRQLIAECSLALAQIEGHAESQYWTLKGTTNREKIEAVLEKDFGKLK